jgi:prepilin-type N-terminal cleavage/methylation domain-containing protein
MKTKRFSLIELLVVIAIIAILIAILIPTVSTVRNNAKKAQAKAQMNAIITAIKTYESTYGVLPIPSSWADANTTNKYADLMALLTDVSGPLTESAYTSGNVRNIRFLDVPNNYTTLGYLDPWNNKYLIYLDTDYDGQVTFGSETLYGTAFITDTAGQTDATKNIFSWK